MSVLSDININCTCSVSPTQYEGTVLFNNKLYSIYIRYRWGILEVTMGDYDKYNNTDSLLAAYFTKPHNVLDYEKEIGEEFESQLNRDEIICYIEDLVKTSEKV